VICAAQGQRFPGSAAHTAPRRAIAQRRRMRRSDAMNVLARGTTSYSCCVRTAMMEMLSRPPLASAKSNSVETHSSRSWVLSSVDATTLSATMSVRPSLQGNKVSAFVNGEVAPTCGRISVFVGRPPSDWVIRCDDRVVRGPVVPGRRTRCDAPISRNSRVPDPKPRYALLNQM
jgi:hypothetical protein